MPVLIVTSKAEDWPFEIPGVDRVDAWTYLNSAEYATATRGTRVFNLCRSCRYQSLGYYVSLLAEARGQRPLPGVMTLQDVKSRSLPRLLPDELDELIQKSLAPLQSDRFALSVFFGRNLAQRYDRLAKRLFNLFPVPLIRFDFVRREGRWSIRRAEVLSVAEIPPHHRDFVQESAARYFSERASTVRFRRRTRFDLAILHNPSEHHNAPSDDGALRKFIKAARNQEVFAELITKDDSGRIAEFDALFIRETTRINDHTYRFSRRAAAEGMVVIDDPVSIARCTNKVFLAEMLNRQKIDTPKTIVVHRDNVQQLPDQLGFPLVLKKPDSSFSAGVVKVRSADELQQRLDDFLGESELLIAQEFLPTTFDWRIGIIDQKPLFACRYFMAPGHWQVIRQEQVGKGRYGKVETVPVELAPPRAVKAALKAANAIGDGLYGVDVKESEGRFCVIEVNDNPNIDSGVEDRVLKDELYHRIIEVFVRRIEQKKARFHG